jgi:hypothetical protein
MTVVLVEGPSDARAVEVLARRRGRDLAAEGVRIESMGGITNLGRRLLELDHTGVRLVTLYDAGEAGYVRRAVERTGVEVGLHVCEADLEDELIRALGVPAVLDVVSAAGELDLWETLTRQPFHRERPADAVLRRFMGTTSGRKIRYAGLLVEAAVDLDRVPRPLDDLLAAALSPTP